MSLSIVPTKLSCKTPAEVEAVRRTYQPLTSLKEVELTMGHVVDAMLFLASVMSSLVLCKIILSSQWISFCLS